MKKENKKKSVALSVTKITAGLVLLISIASCKKDKTAIAVAPIVTHNYNGTWKNVVPVPTAGPLDWFNFDIKLDAAGKGTLNSTYITTNQTYPQTNLTWQTIAGDSVAIILDIPAYPDEKWELRGLAN